MGPLRSNYPTGVLPSSSTLRLVLEYCALEDSTTHKLRVLQYWGTSTTVDPTVLLEYYDIHAPDSALLQDRLVTFEQSNGNQTMKDSYCFKSLVDTNTYLLFVGLFVQSL